MFMHLGGVPTEIWFDNTSTLVTKILKDGGRQLTDKFLRFSEHYGFRYKFMNPESGWEKGKRGEQGWIQPQKLLSCRRPGSWNCLNTTAVSLQRLTVTWTGSITTTTRRYWNALARIRRRFSHCRMLRLIRPGMRRYSRINGAGSLWRKGSMSYSVSPLITSVRTCGLKITSRQVQVMDMQHRLIVTHRAALRRSRNSQAWNGCRI